MLNDSPNADNTTSKIASLWENQRKIVPMPPLQAMHIHGNDCSGFRVCHTCRGERLVAVRSKWDNRITYKKCMSCRGNGSIYVQAR